MNEVAFRMSQLHERVQISYGAWSSSVHHALAEVRHRLELPQRGQDMAEHVRHALHRLWQILHQHILAHPRTAHWYALAREACRAAYLRLSPIWLELAARHSLALVGGAGFLVGVAFHRYVLRAGCPMKPQRMRGILCSGYRGDLDTGLKIPSRMIAPRITHPNQVLIRVHAASLDPTDLSQVLNGLGRHERLHGVKSSFLLGRDLVGVAVEVGWRVRHLSSGDRVWTARPLLADGTFAQFVLADAAHVQLAPTNLDDAGAATVPYSGLAAWAALEEGCRLRPFACHGKAVLVADGASSSGCLAVQLLRAWGCSSIATCVPERVVPLAHMLGADHVIACGAPGDDAEVRCGQQLAKLPPFDAVLLTSDLFSSDFCRQFVRPAGAGRVAATHLSGGLPSDSYGLVRRRLLRLYRSLLASSPHSRLDYANLNRLRTLIESGAIQPVLDSEFGLNQARRAFEHLASGEPVIGKVVLRFNGEEEEVDVEGEEDR